METNLTTKDARDEIKRQKLMVYGKDWTVEELQLDVREQRLAEEIADDTGMSVLDVRNKAGGKLRKRKLGEPDLETKTVAELWVQLETNKQNRAEEARQLAQSQRTLTVDTTIPTVDAEPAANSEVV